MQTELLSSDPQGIERAAEILKNGGLCAIPTETVYGLAASALDGAAVSRIFAAKGRPSDNPLIVHICKVEDLYTLWESVPPQALTLAKAFWPGPMTLICKRKPIVPDEVTAGLDTVGVRLPSHPAARAVIEKAGVPLAAPSANLSGKPSPTTLRHVCDDMTGRIDAILDGGDCSVGVESTVIDLTGEVPRILRPGAVSEEMVADVLGAAETDPAVTRGLREGEKARSPGMKYRHYAPASPVRLFCGAPDDSAAELLTMPRDGAAMVFDEYLAAAKARFAKALPLGRSHDFAEHSRRIFTALRELDGAPYIYAQCPREKGHGAAAVNRLRRAASFDCVDCTRYTVIGVTGRSGSGKGHISKGLSSASPLQHFDSDEVYKAMLSSDCEMTRGVAAAFPECVADGRIDRRALGNIVFRDREKKLLLESLTHPFVAAEARRFIAEKGGAILDAPLLFEAGMDRLCTVTVGVYCDDETAVSRIVSRDGIGEEAARLRLNAQPPLSFYTEKCDIMLRTPFTGDFKKLADKLIK